jgi:hypothetical protein
MRLILVAIAGLTIGCGGGSPSGGFEIDGLVHGTGAPAQSHVVVLWDLVDTGYKWGDGTATATTFMLPFDQDPPAGAINPGGLAVGYPILVADGTTIPDGPVTNISSIPQIGIAIDYAVIWKSPTATGVVAWDAAFGARYSCGKCVRAQTGHDSFELTACAPFTIEFGGGAGCNWS